MKYVMYAYKDTVTGNFGAVELAVNVDQAKRNFLIACRKATPEIAKDLQLFTVGEFDIETGCIIPNVSFVMNCTEVNNEAQ